MDSLSTKITPLLSGLTKPSQYIGGEFNSPEISIKDTNSNFNFCFVYPDVYEVGFPNQALRILCNAVNEMDGFLAQRAFLPAPEAIETFKKADVAMFSLETKSPLCQFDAISITVSHELAATNICETLDFGGISVCADERSDDEPIIFGGGPVCCNPEPFVKFFDVFTIGEGEIVLPKCLSIVRDMRAQGKSRTDILQKLSKVEGTYVPSVFELGALINDSEVATETGTDTKKIEKVIYTDFANSGAYSRCVVPFVEVTHDRLNVEILRGCARGCRFCQAGFMYRPVRERPVEDILKAVDDGLKQTGYDEVSLTSLSSTDHSQISEVLNTLNKKYEGRGVRVSIPSQRLDKFGVNMASLVAGGKKGGLTFAPEAGSQRMRDTINKNVCEQDIFGAVESAIKAGWNRCKLYFMIGLPTETDEDVLAIADLCNRLYKAAREAAGGRRQHGINMSASVAVFVPKAQTPFQWEGIISPDEALRRIKLIRHNLEYRPIKLSYHDPYTSCIEAFLSRGDRGAGEVIYSAWKSGCHFDAWDEYFNFVAWIKAGQDCDIDIISQSCKTYSTDTLMPWEHIFLGIDRSFLESENNRAHEAKLTPDCTMDKCSGCGVCTNLKVANQIAGSRKS